MNNGGMSSLIRNPLLRVLSAWHGLFTILAVWLVMDMCHARFGVRLPVAMAHFLVFRVLEAWRELAERRATQ